MTLAWIPFASNTDILIFHRFPIVRRTDKATWDGKKDDCPTDDSTECSSIVQILRLHHPTHHLQVFAGKYVPGASPSVQVNGNLRSFMFSRPWMVLSEKSKGIRLFHSSYADDLEAKPDNCRVPNLLSCRKAMCFTKDPKC